MGSWVVKHSSAAFGSSPYSAVVDTTPEGSTHSTRNRSPVRTCRAENQRKACLSVGWNSAVALGMYRTAR